MDRRGGMLRRRMSLPMVSQLSQYFMESLNDRLLTEVSWARLLSGTCVCLTPFDLAVSMRSKARS